MRLPVCCEKSLCNFVRRVLLSKKAGPEGGRAGFPQSSIYSVDEDIRVP